MKFSPDEVILLVLGISVLPLAARRWDRLERVPFRGLLSASYLVLLAGWVLTNAEAYLWKEGLNLLEHACYALSTLLLSFWCFLIFGKGERR